MADSCITCYNSAFAERSGIKVNEPLAVIYEVCCKVELEVAYELSSRLHSLFPLQEATVHTKSKYTLAVIYMHIH